MIYLTGASNAPCRQWASEGAPLGLLVTPRSRYEQQIRHYATWAADNGCFTSKDWTVEAWWTWLENLDPTGCLFATAPDVVADWPATLVTATPWLPRIRALGFPVAIVAQDGATIETVPWDEFDALFVGGTDAWKLGPDCCEVMAEAKRRGKHVHVGRVNSWKRLHRCVLAGADTADGTFIAFGPDKNVPRVKEWFRRMQPMLPLCRGTRPTGGHAVKKKVALAVVAVLVLVPSPAEAHRRRPHKRQTTANVLRVSSTAYCLTGRMASGQRVYRGAVAMNRVPLGSRWRVRETGVTYTVADRIGHSSGFDVAMPGDCPGARRYGRRTVTVERVG